MPILAGSALFCGFGIRNTFMINTNPYLFEHNILLESQFGILGTFIYEVTDKIRYVPIMVLY